MLMDCRLTDDDNDTASATATHFRLSLSSSFGCVALRLRIDSTHHGISLSSSAVSRKHSILPFEMRNDMILLKRNYPLLLFVYTQTVSVRQRINAKQQRTINSHLVNSIDFIHRNGLSPVSWRGYARHSAVEREHTQTQHTNNILIMANAAMELLTLNDLTNTKQYQFMGMVIRFLGKTIPELDCGSRLL